MYYLNIVKIEEEIGIEKVNRRLQDGWVIVNMYTKNDTIYYVLGEKRKACSMDSAVEKNQFEYQNWMQKSN